MKYDQTQTLDARFKVVLVWERETVCTIARGICIAAAFCVHGDCCVRSMHGDECAFRPFDVGCM